jgi:hypothetical protein
MYDLQRKTTIGIGIAPMSSANPPPMLRHGTGTLHTTLGWPPIARFPPTVICPGGPHPDVSITHIRRSDGLRQCSSRHGSALF